MSTTTTEDGELPRPVVIATMAGVIAAMLMSALDGTIVGTAMPRVIADLHGFEHYAAVTTVYMLTSTIVIPIAGKLSDIYGRKTFLLLGVAIFVVGSSLCGWSTSMMQLVIFRGLQGVGGGLTAGMALTTIADLFPPVKRGRIGGLMGSVFGVASIIGPTVGGFLTDGPGWRWCFWVNIPLGGAAFLVLLLAFPAKKRSSAPPPAIDYLGALALICSATPLLLALSWGGRDYAWTSPTIVAMLAVGAAVAVAFFFIERRAPAAIIPPSLFKNRVIAASSVGAMLIAAGNFGTLIFIPLFMQGVVGTTATKSGTVMAPVMFAVIASSMAAGNLMTRIGRYKVVAVVGSVIVTVGFGSLATMTIDTTYTGVLVRMVVMGIGLGTTMPVFNLAVQNAVDLKDVGVATSSLTFLRSMGGSVGAAIFGAIMTNQFTAAFHAALPADVVARVPPAALAQFDNPQMLMNPKAQAALRDPASAVAPVLEPLLQAVKVALAGSLHTVFIACAAVMAVAILTTLALKDLPLRKTNRPGPPPNAK